MKFEISAIQIAYNLYVKGHGLTHAVRMANAEVANIFKKVNPDKEITPDLFTNAHNLSYQVKKDGITHHYAKCYNPDAIAKMKKEFAAGKSKTKLAEQYGVSYGTITNYLNSNI